MSSNQSTDFIIDGSIGGGSVLRVAVPIALAKDKSIKIFNIRANRSTPGLRLQHLAGLELLSKLANSKLFGGYIGSTEIIVIPKDNESNTSLQNFSTIHLHTAASVSLIVQTLANYVFASRRSVGFEFKGGGSHTEWSPNFDYLERVSKPIFKQFGIEQDIQLDRVGYFPKGGAQGKIQINPIPFSRITLDKGELQYIDIISNASMKLQKARVAERQVEGFKSSKIQIRDSIIQYHNTSNLGTSCTSISTFSGNTIKGSSFLGKRGIPAEKVGKLTSNEVIEELEREASVDRYMADQLLVPLAFSPSQSSYTIHEMTPHVNANLNIISKLLGDVIHIIENGTVIELVKH